LIARYIGAVKLTLADNQCSLVIDAALKAEVAMLKELVWSYVIEGPSLASQQYGQQRIIRELFAIFADASSDPESQRIFPAYYRERLEQAGEDESEKKRTCIDLLAGMTEKQAVSIHQRLTGSLLGSALEDVLA
jgi:dGTPase